MSELQLGLIIAGIVIVVAVYSFNRYQERQFRRRMERKFHDQRPADALLQVDAPHQAKEARVEPHVGSPVADPGPPADADKAEPPVDSAVEAEGEVSAESPALAPFTASSRPASTGAVGIDYVCHIEAAEPISHAALTAFLKSIGMLGKPVTAQGWSLRSNEWVALPCPSEIPLVRIQAALQLADRSGAVNRVQLSTMRDLVQQLAEEVGVSCDCPDIDAAAHDAAQLDRFCAQVDISIGCNLLPNGSTGLSGTKLRGLLESAGFTLDPSGRFVLRSEEGFPLIAAENIEDEPLSVERLRAAPINGLVFTMDVPKVAAGARVFDRMMELGRHLAQALDARVVDDNRAPLTEAGVKVIRQQLRTVQAAMDTHGIAAGSAISTRLFS